MGDAKVSGLSAIRPVRGSTDLAEILIPVRFTLVSCEVAKLYGFPW